MSFYHEVQLQEIMGGNFVIVNEDLFKEFDEFKHKLYSSVERGFTVVEAVELVQIWCRSSNLCLRETQLLGKKYFVMSSSQYRNRSTCNSQENIVALLLEASNSKSFEKETDHHLISYNPVCIEWQISKCNLLGLHFCQDNNVHHGIIPAKMIEVSQKPLRTARIVSDGNCFFRCIAMILTGSQEYHEEMRLLITTYMTSNSSNEKLSSLLPQNQSMQTYIMQSKMQFLGEWATDLEITAASCWLNTKIYVWNFTGTIYEWALYSPHEEVNDLHQEESIFITNVYDHFEVVKKM